MGRKYAALLLIALVVGAECSQVADQQLFRETASLLRQAKPTYAKSIDFDHRNGFGLSANLNSYVDTALPLIVNFIATKGLDPMPLPDLEEGFEVRYLLVTYSANLGLTSGSLTNLVSIKRSGDALVSYFAKMLRIKMEFSFKDLEFVYRYLVKVMNIGPTGRIIGSLDELNIVVDILIDFNNDEIQLQNLSIEKIGRLSVRLTGSLVSWLVSPVVSVFTRLFNNSIMGAVESGVRGAVKSALDDINASVKEVTSYLDSF